MGDDDIAASLPRPPFPAPARREAAIAEALRRFDGEAPAPSGQARRRPRAVSWRPSANRPFAGALAGAFLVALIGIPLVWTSFDRSIGEGGREPRPGVEAPPAEVPRQGADSSAADVAPPEPGPASKALAAADGNGTAEPAQIARTDPSPQPARVAGKAPVGVSQEPVADVAAPNDGVIEVTGSRVRRPNLSAASPVAVLGGEDRAVVVTGTRVAAAPALRRGDWNACTIDDPGRSLAACRKLVGPAAKGASGRAAAHVAEGLSSGWDGDWEAAIASFDRAIEAAPRSSAAYLNRALAWRRRGDLDRALADLDRAVRYSPGGARFYYHRSLVLRQRGDLRRARADEERAVDLDPSYADLVGKER
ncbi:MAG: hypothetical protein QOG72_402 [Sphingomonadales bacterium]|jgi:hypothetical protein|nr:hypothetical protein [Sphingomonadales bacterium]